MSENKQVAHMLDELEKLVPKTRRHLASELIVLIQEEIEAAVLSASAGEKKDAEMLDWMEANYAIWLSQSAQDHMFYKNLTLRDLIHQAMNHASKSNQQEETPNNSENK